MITANYFIFSVRPISLVEETADFKPPFTKDCTEEKKVQDAIIEYVEKVLRDDLPGKE